MTIEDTRTEAMEAYVYGVMRADAVDTLPDDGVGPLASPLRAVTRGRLSAVISSVPDGELAATRDDLFRHTEILQTLMAAGTVLPFRFGTIMPDEETVAGELLDGRHGELEGLLETLVDKVELSLSASYHESVFGEVVAESPEISRLNQQVRSQSADAAYYERIRLGELVAEALERKRDRDGGAIVERLTELAVDVVTGPLPHERSVLSAAFLVDRNAVTQFDVEAGAVADEQAERMRFRYTGPLPPFSFARLEERAGWA